MSFFMSLKVTQEAVYLVDSLTLCVMISFCWVLQKQKLLFWCITLMYIWKFVWYCVAICMVLCSTVFLGSVDHLNNFNTIKKWLQYTMEKDQGNLSELCWWDTSYQYLFSVTERWNPSQSNYRGLLFVFLDAVPFGPKVTEVYHKLSFPIITIWILITALYENWCLHQAITYLPSCIV